MYGVKLYRNPKDKTDYIWVVCSFGKCSCNLNEVYIDRAIIAKLYPHYEYVVEEYNEIRN